MMEAGFGIGCWRPFIKYEIRRPLALLNRFFKNSISLPKCQYFLLSLGKIYFHDFVYILSGAEIPIKAKVFFKTILVAKIKAKRAFNKDLSFAKTLQSL